MEWVSRFGVCRLAVSDNGNSFVSNLYKDVMATFNIKVHFTPNYHPASNGILERRHQTIKNALKASLIDMGNHHGDKWTLALPWVLLGKRAAFQADLNTSPSLLAFGRSPLLPGQLLGHPGPALNNQQTAKLLDQLYQLENRPALQTSSTAEPIDIATTEKATHVYVKVHEPRGLNPRFEGPFEIVSRPSRTQLEVKIGAYANGEPRLSVYNWSSCKIAHLREDFVEGSRPKLGRKVAQPSASDKQTKLTSDAELPGGGEVKEDRSERGKIQMRNSTSADPTSAEKSAPRRPVRSTRNQSPRYAE